ncbi:hypothetical protein [Halosimplex halophilum]|uniref:hypothetical protein n=1 Tax=Halosimplex halophilum TaxID=2559572 RepID=UPI00107F9428|nr:hypothetical protein [Halosimplex halophilum]
MSDKVQEILSGASQSDDVSHEFDSSVLQRYQSLLLDVRQEIGGERFGQIQAGLKVIEISLLAVGALLGFALSFKFIDTSTKVLVWVFYLTLLFFVGLTLRLVPSELRLLNEKVTRIRLVNLCERLAGQLALFDLIYDEEFKNEDEERIIDSLSKNLPPYDSLSEEDKSTIKNCLDDDRIFEDSRETNIALDDLEISNESAERLNRATKEIVDLCPYIFTGGNFTAKLYLRTKMEVCGDENIEVLTSFTKYPAASDRPRGSSWVKARGNPSIVWQALEDSQPKHVQEKNLGEYYDSVLAIPLPGRIGVLAITSDRIDAFVDKDDEISVRALAVASRANALQALEISES